jgi:hypothetical protein
MKEREWKTGSPLPSGNINPDADYAICTIYGNTALGRPNGVKETDKKNWVI